jgi:shikimate kinase
MIARKAGTSIPEIVQGKGWVYFRELEFQVCREVAGQAVCDGEWLLIDAGGGVVVDLDEEGNEMYSTRKVGGLGKGMCCRHPRGFRVFGSLGSGV